MNLARMTTWGRTDLSVTTRKLKRIPMIRPRSTSTRTVAEKVTIQRRPSQRDRERYLETSVIFLNITSIISQSHWPNQLKLKIDMTSSSTCLNIPDSEARMMEARTQTGSGSNSGPRERMTASSARLEVRPVSRERQPDLSCTRDLESEADMGRQCRNEPTMLLTPWATHSGLGGTL